MKMKKQNLSRWLFGIAILITFSGCAISIWVFSLADLHRYPTRIADAYRETQHHLTVPGTKDVWLTRTGAYGIYYEYSQVSATANAKPNLPPAIDCSLASLSSGERIKATPDYVATNRYWSKNQEGWGVLIMSIAIPNPGTYTFFCDYQDESLQPEIVVALGPNYFWEFLSVAWEIVLPILGGIGIVCASSLLSVMILMLSVYLKLIYNSREAETKLNPGGQK